MISNKCFSILLSNFNNYNNYLSRWRFQSLNLTPLSFSTTIKLTSYHLPKLKKRFSLMKSWNPGSPQRLIPITKLKNSRRTRKRLTSSTSNKRMMTFRASISQEKMMNMRTTRIFLTMKIISRLRTRLWAPSNQPKQRFFLCSTMRKTEID